MNTQLESDPRRSLFAFVQHYNIGIEIRAAQTLQYWIDSPLKAIG